ncbi:hypothetical protein L1266_17660 [Pseudoalteromonas sp. Cn5-37]|uniref:haloacid dehalogenase-like hydrolase n=1 Tax=Pseudoalteromonas sp. Cn5-37 TaxID=2908886 RepID=UPI001F282E40|nr:haloacid dehalogenase-like hydrolase [Pseudoalteromonas sp. Cn5-37]MCF2918005.1 hypothetical protein [Pseudoalteromonas sp. Cn5-37]
MVVFDLCGTLVFKNTTFEFVLFISKRNKNYIKYLVASALNSFFGKALYLIFKPFGFSLRNSFIYLLKGYTTKELEDSAALYANYTIKNFSNKHALDKLREMQLRNELILISSASIEPVVRAFGSILCVEEVVATKLVFFNDTCSGKIDSCYDTKGCKELYLKNDFSNLKYVFTDNLDDYNLCALSEIAVLYSDNKNLKKWDSIISNYLSHVDVKVLVKD